MRSASRVAAGLRARGLGLGQSVGLMLPTSLEYFYGFFGILLAGGVPVPLYPPFRLAGIEDHLKRQAGILNNAHAPFLIAMPEAQPLTRLLQSMVEGLQEVITLSTLARGEVERPALGSADVALLQYTSGSTGNPKGVVLTHANLLANIRAMGQVTRVSSRDVFVSWLPLYHDMGLIGAWLGSLYFAMPLVLMSPLTFLARPERWLWAIHRYRGTISAAPNFAYEVCARRIGDPELAGLDLSSWRLAVNGAEPVSPDTLQRFAERFQPHGFQSEALTPVYGLAESAVGLAFPAPGRGPRIDHVRREALMRESRAEPTDPDDPGALRFVSCGSPLPAHQIRIVDDQGREIPEREVGRLEFRGPSCTHGYFRNPEQTRRLFHGDWLDSGDMAYVTGGEVYLTGRAKDLIIRGGRHIFPQELEAAVGDLPGIRKGRVAVFGSKDPLSGTERLIVLAETRERDPQALLSLRQGITNQTLNLLGLPPDEVVLAPPDTVLKTSSGKIRRAANRELFESGSLGGKSRAVWLQLARLYRAGLAMRGRRLGRQLSLGLYAAYAWAVFLSVAVLVWPLVLVLPRETWRQVLVHQTCRLLVRLLGIRLAVHGLEHLASCRPCVMVCNHASYLDALVLAATLPPTVRYVAKREFLGHLIPGRFLARLGARFVDRLDPVQAVTDAQRLSETVRSGETILLFPEGAFGRAPGLRPFHMGAFTIAAETRTPVLPLALHGTRSLLRAHAWFPRRGAVMLTIGRAIVPEGTDWAAANRLREASYEQIVRHCGEPALESEERS